MALVKYSAIQKNISTKFGNYGNDLYATFVFAQYFGKLLIVRKWKALGLEETSLTSCPPLERFLLTISSIWCHLWKSTQARPMRFSAQFSALESSVDTPSRGARCLHPRFSSSTVKHSQTHCCRQAAFLIEMVIYLFFLEKVWYYNKMNETLRTWKANSHLPSRCPRHLGTNDQIFQVSNCPQHELQDQIKFPRICQMEYLRGHQNSHLLRGRASTAQQGRGWLDLNMTFPKWWAPNLVRVPPEVWN